MNSAGRDTEDEGLYEGDDGGCRRIDDLRERAEEGDEEARATLIEAGLLCGE